MNNEQIVKALKNVSTGTGINCLKNREHELGYMAKYVDDYLATGVLAELIKDNKVELVFKVGKEDARMEYFCRLLEEE